MTSSQSIDCVLWDFSGTLAHEGWELEPSDGLPSWRHAWLDVAKEWGAVWDRGEIDGQEFARRVGARLGWSTSQVLAHVDTCASRLQFFELPLRIIGACRLPQGLVTIIPDIFSKFVVPRFGLGGLFQTIVTSWEEHSLDKRYLCEMALQRLGGSIPRSRAFFIDNVEENVRRWAASGGQAYWFRDEAQFERDLRLGLRCLWEVSCGRAS